MTTVTGGSPTLFTMTPITTPFTLVFGLLGDGSFKSASGGTGGWQIVDRPKQIAVTQWYDRSPWSLELPLMLDSEILYGQPGVSIESQCAILVGWNDKIPGTYQPPIFTITGPVEGIDRQWLINALEFEGAIRDPQAGFRSQQKVQLTLYEYNAPLVSTLQVAGNSPAAAAANALSAATASQTYTIYYAVQGDTLDSIAASQLGNYALWPQIASLNNLRDTETYPGQLIKIPTQPQT